MTNRLRVKCPVGQSVDTRETSRTQRHTVQKVYPLRLVDRNQKMQQFEMIDLFVVKIFFYTFPTGHPSGGSGGAVLFLHG